MQKQYKLLKDIVTPDYTVKAGTLGEPVPDTDFLYRFRDTPGPYKAYELNYMQLHPDFFEEVKPEPKVLSVSETFDFLWTCFGIKAEPAEANLKLFCKKRNLNLTPVQPDSEKKWSDKNMTDFATYNLYTNSGTITSLESWKKEKGYE